MTIENPLEQLSLTDLQKRTSAKWQAYPKDVLPLWVAEMDTTQAPVVKEALYRAIELGDTGYPAGNPMGEALIHFAAARWGWEDLSIEQILPVTDVMSGIGELLKLLTKPGDTVVLNNPVYTPFYGAARAAECEIAEAPVGTDGRLDLDTLEETFKKLKDNNAVYLMSNPHNPGGVVHSREELEKVAQLANEYKVRVISDEIHALLVMTGAKFTPYLSVAGAENDFALTSASKAWNLAGLKAALLIAGSKATKDLEKLAAGIKHGPSHIGIIAQTAAYRGGSEWLDALLAGLDSNRKLVTKLLAKHLPEAKYREPEGTYLAWIDCSALNLNEDTEKSAEPPKVSDLAGPAKYFLENAKVALSSGHVFGSGGEDFVRLNFATNQDILTEAITRMGDSIKNR
ncbi:MAG: aminotransferase class I/II-fold pyridoxal phosphate-dependent enzyme [Micrococcaceae bacterium]